MHKQSKEQTSEQKVYIVCLNPHCTRGDQRCLTTSTLHGHPSECSSFYYPADEIISRHWSELDKYPVDKLGIAARKKYKESKQQNYLVTALNNMKTKMLAQLQELSSKLVQLYPSKEFERCYTNVYGLDKIAESLKLQRDPRYISNLISTNFSATNYHLLLRLNDSYDEAKVSIESLGSKLLGNFQGVMDKHKNTQVMPSGRPTARKYNYGIYKSKFVASLKIQINKTTINFPKLNNIASFLPWIYTDKHFSSGIHEFKLSSLRYPIVQNAGFTVLPEHDIDTYPYTYFKSLFSRDGKGFKLVRGEDIDQFVAQTTVVTLRLQLGDHPKAILFDSQLMCQYECELSGTKTYRMGVYGCGWAMDIIELN